jgi:hypothetical protein
VAAAAGRLGCYVIGRALNLGTSSVVWVRLSLLCSCRGAVTGELRGGAYVCALAGQILLIEQRRVLHPGGVRAGLFPVALTASQLEQ